MVDKLPQLVGPRAEPFDLRFTGRDGGGRDTALLVLVSNNRYAVDPRPRRGTRGQIDRGVLGVIAMTAPSPHGLEEWTASTFRVDSPGPCQPGSTARA